VLAGDIDDAFLVVGAAGDAPGDPVSVAVVAEYRLPELIALCGHAPGAIADRVRVEPAVGRRTTLGRPRPSLEGGVTVELEVGLELEKAQ